MRLPAAYLAAADDTSRVRAIITCMKKEASRKAFGWLANQQRFKFGAKFYPVHEAMGFPSKSQLDLEQEESNARRLRFAGGTLDFNEVHVAIDTMVTGVAVATRTLQSQPQLSNDNFYGSDILELDDIGDVLEEFPPLPQASPPSPAQRRRRHHHHHHHHQAPQGHLTIMHAQHSSALVVINIFLTVVQRPHMRRLVSKPNRRSAPHVKYASRRVPSFMGTNPVGGVQSGTEQQRARV